MAEELIMRFDQMEQKRRQLFEALSQHNDDILNFQPGIDKWSVLEVLQHLKLAEGGSLLYIKKKIKHAQENRPEENNLRAKWRAWVLQNYLKLPFKVKAPEVATGFPHPSVSTELFAEFEQVRMDWKKVLQETPSELADKQIFKHPLAGKMNLYGALGFCQQHFNRHEKQIRRTLSTALDQSR
jgi:hypothetical protein